jgi:hypothetical protein
MGLLVAAALTQLRVRTKGVHAKTRDEMYNLFPSQHDICYGIVRLANVC